MPEQGFPEARKLRAAANQAKHDMKQQERKRYAAEAKVEHIKRVVMKHPCRNTAMVSRESCGDTLCLPCSIRYILRHDQAESCQANEDLFADEYKHGPSCKWCARGKRP